MPDLHVAFVGIGAIGLPMAERIRNGGYAVTGVDPFPTALARAADRGIDAVASVADLPQRPDIVLVMVATPEQLHDLVSEALTVGVSDQLWVVMSTVGPDSVKVEEQRLLEGGGSILDVPVTGGVARAKTGELTLFAAGTGNLIEQARPVLECLGALRQVGDSVGDGQAIKVVNQHLCSVHIVAAAEALELARSLGLDAAKVLDLVGSGAGGSWMLSDRGPRMLADTDVSVTSTIEIFVKDSGLVADAGEESGAQLPLLLAARERYLQAVEMGLARRDDSRVIETFQSVNHSERGSNVVSEGV